MDRERERYGVREGVRENKRERDRERGREMEMKRGGGRERAMFFQYTLSI